MFITIRPAPHYPPTPVPLFPHRGWQIILQICENKMFLTIRTTSLYPPHSRPIISIVLGKSADPSGLRVDRPPFFQSLLFPILLFLILRTSFFSEPLILLALQTQGEVCLPLPPALEKNQRDGRLFWKWPI